MDIYPSVWWINLGRCDQVVFVPCHLMLAEGHTGDIHLLLNRIIYETLIVVGNQGSCARGAQREFEPQDILLQKPHLISLVSHKYCFCIICATVVIFMGIYASVLCISTLGCFTQVLMECNWKSAAIWATCSSGASVQDESDLQVLVQICLFCRASCRDSSHIAAPWFMLGQQCQSCVKEFVVKVLEIRLRRTYFVQSASAGVCALIMVLGNRLGTAQD